VVLVSALHSFPLHRFDWLAGLESRGVARVTWRHA
jgi:hypothetical protein